MSKTEGFLILDSRNAVAAIGDKAEVAARPLSHNVARGKLADISNLPPKGMALTQDQKSQLIPTTVKEYIEQLQKDNMALAKMLAQRNKLVEQSGIELERLRLSFIKMRAQNQHLALSNTQLLAELNSGKDRLKALQHELGCKNGLLQARRLKHEAVFQPSKVDVIDEDEPLEEVRDHEKPRKGKRRMRSISLGSSEQLQSDDNAGNRPRRQSARFKAVQPNGNSLSEMDDTNCQLPDGTVPSTSVDASVINEDRVAPRPSIRRQSTRFKAVETVTTCPNETAEENASTSDESSVKYEDHFGKRPSLRRQSSRFKAVVPEETDDLLHTVPVQENDSSITHQDKDHVVQRPCSSRQSNRAKRPKEDDPLAMNDNKRTSVDEPIAENDSSSVMNEDDPDRGHESQEFGKGRPSRVAARKVHSYKEKPLNVKMRRSE